MKTRTPSARRSLRRKVSALLAGGMVLGLGSAVTLAAWYDNELAQGSFTASTFKTQSRAHGGEWGDHSSSPVTLTFNATAMSPDVSRYASLDVRTTADTNVNGKVWLESAALGAGDLGDYLRYRAVLLGAGSCAASAFGSGATFIAGGPSTYLVASEVPASVTEVTVDKAATQERELCFDVKVDQSAPNTMQGKSGSVTWTFKAASVE